MNLNKNVDLWLTFVNLVLLQGCQFEEVLESHFQGPSLHTCDNASHLVRFLRTRVYMNPLPDLMCMDNQPSRPCQSSHHVKNQSNVNHAQRPSLHSRSLIFEPVSKRRNEKDNFILLLNFSSKTCSIRDNQIERNAGEDFADKDDDLFVGNGTDEEEQSLSKNKAANFGKNFASPDCGAKVVKVSTDVQNGGNLISKNEDEYVLLECSRPGSWFLVELCDRVLITSLQLADMELYAGSVSKIAVHTADKINPKEWTLVGNYSTGGVASKRKQEMLDMTLDTRRTRAFAKFVLLTVQELDSAEEVNHYCTITALKIFGISEYEYLLEMNSKEAGLGDPRNESEAVDDRNEVDEKVDHFVNTSLIKIFGTNHGWCNRMENNLYAASYLGLRMARLATTSALTLNDAKSQHTLTTTKSKMDSSIHANDHESQKTQKNKIIKEVKDGGLEDENSSAGQDILADSLLVQLSSRVSSLERNSSSSFRILRHLNSSFESQKINMNRLLDVVLQAKEAFQNSLTEQAVVKSKVEKLLDVAHGSQLHNNELQIGGKAHGLSVKVEEYAWTHPSIQLLILTVLASSAITILFLLGLFVFFKDRFLKTLTNGGNMANVRSVNFHPYDSLTPTRSDFDPSDVTTASFHKKRVLFKTNMNEEHLSDLRLPYASLHSYETPQSCFAATTEADGLHDEDDLVREHQPIVKLLPSRMERRRVTWCGSNFNRGVLNLPMDSHDLAAVNKLPLSDSRLSPAVENSYSAARPFPPGVSYPPGCVSSVASQRPSASSIKPILKTSRSSWRPNVSTDSIPEEGHSVESWLSERSRGGCPVNRSSQARRRVTWCGVPANRRFE